MIKVGITGGIGSGKTTVSQIFSKLGVPVFNSDLAAREAENNITVQYMYKKILGDYIFVDGLLDRPKMRSIVFTDKDKLKAINDFMIPYIKDEFYMFCCTHKDAPIVMLESAILFETGAYKNFDLNISVLAYEDIRIDRVLNRDGISIEEINNKLKNQISEVEQEKLSDFVIFNDSKILEDGMVHLSEQVLYIYIELCKKVLKTITNE